MLTRTRWLVVWLVLYCTACLPSAESVQWSPPGGTDDQGALPDMVDMRQPDDGAHLLVEDMEDMVACEPRRLCGEQMDGLYCGEGLPDGCGGTYDCAPCEGLTLQLEGTTELAVEETLELGLQLRDGQDRALAGALVQRCLLRVGQRDLEGIWDGQRCQLDLQGQLEGPALLVVELAGGSSQEIEVELYRAYTSVSVGSSIACAIGQAAGRLFCWGRGSMGRLPSDQLEALPVQIGTVQGLQQVSIFGDHGCYLDDQSEIYCWGDNAQGQAAPREAQMVVMPSQLTWPDDRAIKAKHVSVGALHGCAIDMDDRVLCWGDASFGVLGAGDPQAIAARPVFVEGDTRFSELALSREFSCGLSLRDEIWCWGSNEYGILGLAQMTQDRALIPQKVNAPGVPYRGLRAWESHLCMLEASEDRALCWGANLAFLGHSCDPATAGMEDCITPSAAGTMPFSAVAAGASHSCGLSAIDGEEGRAYCWGFAANGDLGIEPEPMAYLDPQPVESALRFATIDCGTSCCAVLRQSGKLACWGRDHETLGRMDRSRHWEPALVGRATLND